MRFEEAVERAVNSDSEILPTRSTFAAIAIALALRDVAAEAGAIAKAIDGLANEVGGVGIAMNENRDEQ